MPAAAVIDKGRARVPAIRHAAEAGVARGIRERTAAVALCYKDGSSAIDLPETHQARPVQEEHIELAIVVIVVARDSATGGLNDVLHLLAASVGERVRESRFARHIR